MARSNGKQLRFAALIRVSTEKQAKRGESLRTQTGSITQAVDSLGGEIVRAYAGQEHATAGYERQLLDKLLADAQSSNRPFDAVIVNDPSRWSRDNVKSETGLDTLRDVGIRFFVLTTEFDLYDPQARLFLGMTTQFNSFQAALQKQKSILNRINRAKRGEPSAGPPFGRVYDREKKEWLILTDKQAMIQDIADRYLAGEQLPNLAQEYGVNHSPLYRTLRDACGDRWVIEFNAPDLNIRETVTLTVPRLLPEATINAVRQRMEANRTYLHKPPCPKNEYLLSGRVFCAACGYTMFGDMKRGRRYYRHCRSPRRCPCPLTPRPSIEADKLESQVIGQLFGMFGNPTQIANAVKAAVPDCDEAMTEQVRLEGELEKVKRARSRILGLVSKDAITEEQAEEELRELNDRERTLRDRLDQLAATLADVPDEETLRLYVEKVNNTIWVYDDEGNQRPGGNDIATLMAMTKQDFRNLVNAVFDTTLVDGKPAGVYISPAGKARLFQRRQYGFTIKGRLEFESVLNASSCGVPCPDQRNESHPFVFLVFHFRCEGT